MTNEARRRLPSVDRLANAILAGGTPPTSRELAIEAARAAISAARAVAAAGNAAPSWEQLVDDASTRAGALARPPLRRVINASGVLLQTNLGRAPLSEAALTAMAEVGGGYSNLEYSLAEGTRGSRHTHVRDLIMRTTGAEDGMVVNNNAAALYFVLSAFATGRDVLVSRGQSVEIGGGFRIPDVLRQSGARLIDVGTTNRTYASDYASAMTEETAALLRVHTSNFALQGFVHETSAGEMARVAHDAGVLLIDDLGSGCLVETRALGMAAEPTVGESLAAGADLALYSGDKLLGGPQCGIIVGRGDLVEELRRHPLARALRVDKTTIAALTATLQSYVQGTAMQDIPLWRMATMAERRVRARARRWARTAGDAGSVRKVMTMIGGGALPGQGVPSWAAAIRAAHVDALHDRLRARDLPIVARAGEGVLLLDPRGVNERDDAYVAQAIEDCNVELPHG